MENLEQTVALAPAPLNNTGVCVKGYQLLIEVPDQDERKGSLYLPESTLRDEKNAGLIGRVIDMGPEAYQGDKFPAGPRCAIGDYVVMGLYTGIKLAVQTDAETRKRREIKLVEDTAVLATVPSPNHVERG